MGRSGFVALAVLAIMGAAAVGCVPDPGGGPWPTTTTTPPPPCYEGANDTIPDLSYTGVPNVGGNGATYSSVDGSCGGSPALVFQGFNFVGVVNSTPDSFVNCLGIGGTELILIQSAYPSFDAGLMACVRL